MRWSALIPSSLVGWQRRQTLRELDKLQRTTAAAQALDERNPIYRAKAALVADDKVLALKLWQEAQQTYPDFARRSVLGIEIEFGLGRLDEAEALSRELQEHMPRDPRPAGWCGLILVRRGELEKAVQHWRSVRRRFPHYWMAYTQCSMCLRRLGRLDEAKALSNRATERFPSEPEVHFESARVAEQRREWPQALSRWKIVQQKFEHVQGDLGAARVLAEMDEFDKAEQLLQEAEARRPDTDDIPIALARLATRRGSNEEALLRWTAVRQRCPKMLVGYQEGYRQLRAMGRKEEAEALLIDAIAKLPSEAWPVVEHAALAHAQKDWTTAVSRWAAVRAKWPDRRDAFERGAEALAALGQRDEAAELKRQLPQISV